MSSLRKKTITIAVAIVCCLAAIGIFVGCEKTPETVPYQPYTCIVTFDAGDGMMNGVNIFSVEVEKGTTVPRPTEIPQRDGYVFWGWNATGNEDDPTWQFDAQKITCDMTIHAVWVSSYTVTFRTEEGTFDDGRNTRTVTAVYGTKITAPTVTQPDDSLELQGWYISGKSWDFSQDTVTHDVTLYAVWDLKGDLQMQLAPFIYTKTDDGYRIDGVKDQNVSGTLTVPNVVTSIRFRAFNGCKNVVSVNVNDSVTHIGHNAFQNCEKLKNVTLPSGLTSIDEYTFSGCFSLEQIQLPDTLTELGGGAFEGCSSLKSINIPSGVTEIGYSAFAGCSSLQAVTLSDNVTTIDNGAFSGCLALRQVELGDNVTTINDFAFNGCSALQQVELGNNLTAIGVSAFNGCSALQAVNLGNSVTTIGSSAFYDCSALREITMGDSVTTIGDYAFKGCTALASFDIPTVVEEIGENAFEGCTALESIIIPTACKTVGSSAFKGCTGLTSAELHCETVDYDAFYDCLALMSVTFGAEVRTIGSAFKNCMGLTAVEIPNTVTTLYAPFHSCPNLRNVTIGDGVKILYNNAFAYCYNLRNVIIGSGVKEIRSYAFYNCGSLLSITIPSNVETIESYAFSGCYKLMEVYNLSQTSRSFGQYVTVHTDASEESIIHNTDDGFSFAVMNDPYYSPVKQNLFLLDYWGDDEDIVLPDDYNGESYKIARHALAYNPRLKSVRFSAGVISIGDEILFGSDNVTSLTVDSGNTRLSAAGNCVIDYTKSFVLGCKTSVIPADGSVTSIDSNVFCHNATIVNAEFKIPDSVRYVEQSAFDGCDGIMRTADNGIVYVDKWAYMYTGGGDELIDLELEVGTVGICASAFWYNSKYNTKNILRSVKFNAELKYLGMNAFTDCDSLIEVIMNDGLVEVVVGAFTGCDNLQEVVIPDSVRIVGSKTFYGCTDLKYVKLPAGLTSYIDYDMFRDCAALEGVVIPQSVNYITNGAFRDCPDTVKIYYCGTEEQWSAVTIKEDNEALINATKYFYSETEIEGVNCWHYGIGGKPTTAY